MYFLNPFPNNFISEWSKLKEFADDIFKFVEIAETSPNLYKTLREKEKSLDTSNFSCPTVFLEDVYSSHVNTRASLGKG